jgi:hypothetical protein
MKICPHCNRKFPKDKSKCPWCGEEYWLPGKTGDREEAEPEQPVKGGCLQILLIPFITALALTLFLIAGGIIIGLFIKLESSEIKFAWIVFSLLLGLAVFFLLHFWKRKKSEDRKNEETQE